MAGMETANTVDTTDYHRTALRNVYELNCLPQIGSFAGSAALQRTVTAANRELELSRRNALSLADFTPAYLDIYKGLADTGEALSLEDLETARSNAESLISQNPDQFVRFMEIIEHDSERAAS